MKTLVTKLNVTIVELTENYENLKSSKYDFERQWAANVKLALDAQTALREGVTDLPDIVTRFLEGCEFYGGYIERPHVAVFPYEIAGLIGEGPYGSDSVREANARALKEEYGSLVSEGRTGYGVNLDVMIRTDHDVLVSLVETLNALDSYPLISDDVHSELECERHEENWNDFLQRDLIRECMADANAEIEIALDAGVIDAERANALYDLAENLDELSDEDLDARAGVTINAIRSTCYDYGSDDPCYRDGSSFCLWPVLLGLEKDGFALTQYKEIPQRPSAYSIGEAE